MRSANLRFCPLWMLFALFISACQHNKGAELIDGLSGYETIQEAQAQLATINPGHHWAEDKVPTDPTDKRPPHEFVYLSGDFQHLGCRGNLRLSFYNNRLMTAEFSPSDGRAYIDALHRTGLALPPASGKEVKIGERTNFTYYADPDGKFRFIWEDSTLSKEWSEWVWKYS